MKILLCIMLSFTIGCSKNKCQTCLMQVVGPDIANGGVRHDTIYKDSKYCGDGLDNQKKENGKYTEYKQGGNTYRYTTLVSCH